MPQTAKLFIHNGDQAVNIPDEFRFDSDEVMIRKDEETGEVILSQRVSDWNDFFKLRDELGGAEPEFMKDVDDPVSEPGRGY